MEVPACKPLALPASGFLGACLGKLGRCSASLCGGTACAASDRWRPPPDCAHGPFGEGCAETVAPAEECGPVVDRFLLHSGDAPPPRDESLAALAFAILLRLQKPRHGGRRAVCLLLHRPEAEADSGSGPLSVEVGSKTEASGLASGSTAEGAALERLLMRRGFRGPFPLRGVERLVVATDVARCIAPDYRSCELLLEHLAPDTPVQVAFLGGASGRQVRFETASLGAWYPHPNLYRNVCHSDIAAFAQRLAQRCEAPPSPPSLVAASRGPASPANAAAVAKARKQLVETVRDAAAALLRTAEASQAVEDPLQLVALPAPQDCEAELEIRYLPKELDGDQILVKETETRWRTDPSAEMMRRYSGLGYRRSKDVADRDPVRPAVGWKESFEGSDEGDGWVKCKLKALDVGAEIGTEAHPVHYAAGALFASGAQRVCTALPCADHPCSIDAVVRLSVWLEERSSEGDFPELLVVCDQWGVLHAPLATGRSYLAASGAKVRQQLALLIHDEDGKIHELTCADLFGELRHRSASVAFGDTSQASAAKAIAQIS